MGELLHVLEPSAERGPQSLKATPQTAIMPYVLTTRPWPARLKRTGTSHMVSHTRHNNEPTLSRNDSPQGCLHLTLAYRYYFYLEEAWEHISVHWQHGSYQLWANCFICSNHQPHDCLLNRVFRRRSKKISKLRVTGLFAGNSPETGEFPTRMASNAENVSIWWRHHVRGSRGMALWWFRDRCQLITRCVLGMKT